LTGRSLEFVANGIKQVRDRHGAARIGALATPQQTLEELYLLQKLMRGIGSHNVDFRTRQADFSADAAMQGAPWLGLPLADIAQLDRVLVVGSTLRNDHPLIANRLRQANKKALQINLVNCIDDDLLMRVANKAIVAPSRLVQTLAAIVRAVAQKKNAAVPAGVAAAEGDAATRAIAENLMSGKNVALWLGNLAQHHPAAAQLHALVQALADLLGAKFGFLGEAANSVGGFIAGAVPDSGQNAAQMLGGGASAPCKAFVLLGVEAELDTGSAAQAMAAMKQAEFVVALSPYQHGAIEYAHALLPVAPFTETSGTFVSTEGRVQSFNAVVLPLAETRPAWKVLRVLGNLLGVSSFNYDSNEAVRKEILAVGEVAGRLSNRLQEPPAAAVASATTAIERIGEISSYQADAIVRRASSLQLTRNGAEPAAAMNSALLTQLGLRDGDSVNIAQGGGNAVLIAQRDDKLPANCIRVPAGHPMTAGLGGLFDGVVAERVASAQKVAV
jgi:NADH-quinone oxidoreductase subunit G